MAEWEWNGLHAALFSFNLISKSNSEWNPTEIQNRFELKFDWITELKWNGLMKEPQWSIQHPQWSLKSINSIPQFKIQSLNWIQCASHSNQAEFNLAWFSDCCILQFIGFILIAGIENWWFLGFNCLMVGYAFAFLDAWLQIQFRIKFAAASATYFDLLKALWIADLLMAVLSWFNGIPVCGIVAD